MCCDLAVYEGMGRSPARPPISLTNSTAMKDRPDVTFQAGWGTGMDYVQESRERLGSRPLEAAS